MKINRHLGALLVFMGAFLTALNLTRLVPTNPDYEASWTTVCIALFLAIAGWITIACGKATR